MAVRTEAVDVMAFRKTSRSRGKSQARVLLLLNDALCCHFHCRAFQANICNALATPFERNQAHSAPKKFSKEATL